MRLTRENGGLTVAVVDNGVGGADPVRSSGPRGLLDRLSALGGSLEVDSRPGRRTTPMARIPCG